MLPERIFFTGVPGSGWSVISQIIEAIPGMNTSDRHTSRQYTHASGATHVGAYFGEKMEYSLDLGVENLDSPWIEDGGCRLIKSHDWAFCLDEIKYRYPTAWILLIYRNTELSFTHWIDAGGFDISYPNYQAYIDSPTMLTKIMQQNAAILEFGQQHNAEWKNLTTSWIEKNFNRTLPDSDVAKYASKFVNNDTTITLIK